MSFHSRSLTSGSRHSKVISNSYLSSNLAGLLRTDTLSSETVAMMLLLCAVCFCVVIAVGGMLSMVDVLALMLLCVV